MITSDNELNACISWKCLHLMLEQDDAFFYQTLITDIFAFFLTKENWTTIEIFPPARFII